MRIKKFKFKIQIKSLTVLLFILIIPIIINSPLFEILIKNAPVDEKSVFINSHWCGSNECEEKIKDDTKATIRTIPFDQKQDKGTCLFCGQKSDGRVIFAKAY